MRCCCCGFDHAVENKETFIIIWVMCHPFSKLGRDLRREGSWSLGSAATGMAAVF